jgi:cytochrome o ubiquinol oxidase subunit IV
MSQAPAQSADGAEKPVFYLKEDHHTENGTSIGFWLYLMSDCLIFATLFATYAVVGRSYAAGPSGADLFDLKLVAINTAFLLLSSITYGFAMLEAQKKKVNSSLIWLGITGLFGIAFLCLELYEFYHLIHEGATPQRSAFLSAFFALVGTHGADQEIRFAWCKHAPPDLPFHVLAFPGRNLDRRLFLCLPGWSSVMGSNTHEHNHAHGHDHAHDHDHHDSGEDHGSFKSYMIGFILSVILTAIPFWLVMGDVLENRTTTVIVIMIFGVIQVFVHMIYFLHMNTKSQGGWTFMSLLFTLVVVMITLVGSLWVMYNMNKNMMPTMTMEQMRNMP